MNNSFFVSAEQFELIISNEITSFRKCRRVDFD